MPPGSHILRFVAALGLVGCTPKTPESAPKPSAINYKKPVLPAVHGPQNSPDALVGHADLPPIRHSPGQPLLASENATVVVYSPDGNSLISAGGGPGEYPPGTDQLHVWSLETGRPITTFGSPRTNPSALAWAGTPAWLVAAEVRSKVVVWEPENKRVIGTLEAGASVYALACTRKQRLCATGDNVGQIALWNLEHLLVDGQDAPELAAAKPLWQADAPAFELALAADGGKLYAPNLQDKTASIVVLDTASGKILDEFGVPGEVRSIELSPDESRIAVGSASPKGPVVSIISLPKGKPVAQMYGHTSEIYDVGWLDAGKKLASASSDKTVRIWTSLGEHLRTLPTDSTALWKLDIHPDGTQIAAAGNRRSIFVWETQNYERVFATQRHSHRVTAVAWTADGNELLSTDFGGKLLAQRPADGLIRASQTQEEPFDSLQMHPNGQSFLTVSRAQVQIWDLRTMQATSSLPSALHADYRFNADGTSLFMGDSSRLVQELDATTGTLKRTFGLAEVGDAVRENYLRATSVALTPDGRHMAMARWDQPVAIYDLKTNKQIRELPGTIEAVFRPDGKHLAVGEGYVSKRGDELSVVIYETTTWNRVIELPVEPRGMRYTPDGKYLAVLENGGVGFWDPASGARVGLAKTDHHRISVFAIHPQGTVLATGGEDGSVATWDLSRLTRAD